jgi:hypothetical protein
LLVQAFSISSIDDLYKWISSNDLSVASLSSLSPVFEEAVKYVLHNEAKFDARTKYYLCHTYASSSLLNFQKVLPLVNKMCLSSTEQDKYFGLELLGRFGKEDDMFLVVGMLYTEIAGDADCAVFCVYCLEKRLGIKAINIFEHWLTYAVRKDDKYLSKKIRDVIIRLKEQGKMKLKP